MNMNALKKLARKDHFEALAVATEQQMLDLIDEGFWGEDDYARWQDVQEEEMRGLIHCVREFDIIL